MKSCTLSFLIFPFPFSGTGTGGKKFSSRILDEKFVLANLFSIFSNIQETENFFNSSSVCQSVHQSICPSVHLSVRPSVSFFHFFLFLLFFRFFLFFCFFFLFSSRISLIFRNSFIFLVPEIRDENGNFF